MTYNLNTIATVANDGDLQQRFIACAAQEGVANPEAWVTTNKWELAAQDVSVGGLLDAYQYVIDTDPNHYKDWGRDPGIINDAMILSVVQAVNAP